jgi:hypothetical protein
VLYLFIYLHTPDGLQTEAYSVIVIIDKFLYYIIHVPNVYKTIINPLMAGSTAPVPVIIVKC